MAHDDIGKFLGYEEVRLWPSDDGKQYYYNISVYAEDFWYRGFSEIYIPSGIDTAAFILKIITDHELQVIMSCGGQCKVIYSDFYFRAAKYGMFDDGYKSE